MKTLSFIIALTFASTLSAQSLPKEDNTQLKLEIFKRVLKNKCNEGKFITSAEASSVTKAIQYGYADEELFLKSYKLTCDYNTAASISGDKEFGAKTYESMKDSFNVACESSTALDLRQSYIIGMAAAHGYVNTESFVEAFKVSCDYDSSVSIASLDEVQNVIKDELKNKKVASDVAADESKREISNVKEASDDKEEAKAPEAEKTTSSK